MKRNLINDNALAARINVTPLIDVCLTLVIILLITAPMITVLNMEVDLPQARTRSVEDEARLSITLDASGTLALDEDIIAPQDLAAALGRRLAQASDENMLVVIRADSNLPYEKIRELIKIAKEAGARRIAIATRQRDKESV